MCAAAPSRRLIWGDGAATHVILVVLATEKSHNYSKWQQEGFKRFYVSILTAKIFLSSPEKKLKLSLSFEQLYVNLIQQQMQVLLTSKLRNIMGIIKQ